VITADRAAAVLLALDMEWRYVREIDDADPSPVPVLRWLRARDLVAYRPPNRDLDHPVGEWATSDSGLALADSVRDERRTRADLVASVPLAEVMDEADHAETRRIYRTNVWDQTQSN
jgi:hypothetical protein